MTLANSGMVLMSGTWRGASAILVDKDTKQRLSIMEDYGVVASGMVIIT